MRGFPLVRAARAVGWCPSFIPLEFWHWWRWWMAGTSTTNGGGLCLRPDPRVPRPTTTPRCISTPLSSADDDGVCVASHSRCIFSVPVANSELRVRRPRSVPCGITDFVGNEASRETNRAETVVRRRANAQVSRHHRSHRRREPTFCDDARRRPADIFRSPTGPRRRPFRS